jgi:hypothetical protein
MAIADAMTHTGDMFAFVAWLILLVLAWPLALVALVLYPLVFLLLLPFRVLGISVRAVLDLVEVVIRLPFRVLGGRPVRQ